MAKNLGWGSPSFEKISNITVVFLSKTFKALEIPVNLGVVGIGEVSFIGAICWSTFAYGFV